MTMPAASCREIYRIVVVGLWLATLWLAPVSPCPAAEPAAPSGAPSVALASGLGPRGECVGLAFESGGVPVLVGAGARRQLVVTGSYSSGQRHDVTGAVTWEVSPVGHARIGADGFLEPLADGDLTITARLGDSSAALPLRIERTAEELPVSFTNEIVPIFTRLGCNAGGCHGKSDGQNGFRLSLLGFEPAEDYAFLVHETRGRRIFPADPEFSLLITKPTNLLPHGGGRRLAEDSHERELLVRWIRQGVPFGSADDPVIERIRVIPEQREMPFDGRQQLAVIGDYSDGSQRDVTRLAMLESNQAELATVDSTGLVTTKRRPGEAAVMVRFQGKVALFRALLPQGLTVAATPPERNFVDTAVINRLRRLGLPPSPVCNDGTFIRRATIDIAGRLPTADEVRAFLAASSADKRDRLVDRLIASPDYADNFAAKWSAVLRNKRRNGTDSIYTFRFHDWLRDALDRNLPYDQIVRGVLTAAGDAEAHPPVQWFREVSQPGLQMEDTAQLFLGMRLGCAKCHHHPFEEWSQQDYYGFEAFFTQVGLKNSLFNPQQNQPDMVYLKDVVPASTNPRTGKPVPPTPLGGAALDIPAWEDARHRLVDWMVEPTNPFFAKALVNRTWKHFMGRGIVEPEDDLRVTNPPTNPELLDALAARFIASGFDLKDLVRTICTSSAYQLSSEATDDNRLDRQNFSSFQPRRLTAEILFDAINSAVGVPATFNGLPAGTRAVQLPDNGFDTYFLKVFGKPEATSACECERNPEANLAQSLHLLNSQEVQGRLQGDKALPATFAKDEARSLDELIDELYLRAFARQPTAAERGIVRGHVEGADNRQQAWEDILWAVLNAKEFQFVW
ncbi:MAG: DUF1553 domain-containing protein [Planctomycetaceae bacterium]|nr:DUF1553 domain-containing protein [Planctomycetaceae bacterium]